MSYELIIEGRKQTLNKKCSSFPWQVLFDHRGVDTRTLLTWAGSFSQNNPWKRKTKYVNYTWIKIINFFKKERERSRATVFIEVFLGPSIFVFLFLSSICSSVKYTRVRFCSKPSFLLRFFFFKEAHLLQTSLREYSTWLTVSFPCRERCLMHLGSGHLIGCFIDNRKWKSILGRRIIDILKSMVVGKDESFVEMWVS